MEDLRRIKIGLVAVATEALDLAQARKNVEESLKALKNLNFELIYSGDLVMNTEEARKVGKQFRENDIDLLLIQVGTWSPDNIATTIINGLNVPFMLWAVPEVIKGGFPDGGMLVGLTQIGGTLTKLDKRFKILYGYPNDRRILNQIMRTVKVIGVVKRLRNTKVGLLGARCPGMSDATFHELELRNVFGIEVVHIDLSEVAKGMQKITTKEAEDFLNNELKKTGTILGPTEKQMLEAAQIYLSIKSLVNLYNLDGVAVKCWPELRQLNIMSPCFALSKLSNEGIMASCEGDLTAAVSMLILYYITGKSAYLGDCLAIDEKENTARFFHCGAAATALAEDSSMIELRLHAEKESQHSAWKKGVTVEFPLKPGRVTYARLGEIKGNYRLLITSGEALPTDMFVRGNTARIKFDTNVYELIQKFIKEGAEHHYILTHGDIKEELVELCEFLGIRYVII